MTIVTQADEARSKDGRLAINSRVFCPVFDVDEDPVVSISLVPGLVPTPGRALLPNPSPCAWITAFLP